MNNKPEKLHTEEKAFITVVTSAFRSIDPSYTNAFNWYTQKNPTKSMVSRVATRVKSQYYAPIFGSVFASALAFVMILTSQNPTLPTSTMTFETQNVQQDESALASFSTQSAPTLKKEVEQKRVLAKIDAQTKVVSRTQADESFTESLDVETSLQDLFE